MYTAVIGAVAALVFGTQSVSAHGGVVSFSVDGGAKVQGWQAFNSATGQSTPGRPYSSFNPILSPTDATMHCNDDGTAGPSPQTLVVPAGSTITDYYSQWTHAEGPYTVYLGACPDSGCNSVNTASLKWFKIYELGLISGTVYTGKWANGQLMANLKWDTVIPKSLKPGYYIIRWETLALHQSNTPQFYPECAQIQVTGSGTTFPTSDYLVSIPGAWKTSDPGVTIDIYGEAAKTQTTYLIPGPRVYPGFGVAAPPNLPGSGTGSPSSTAGSGSPTGTTSAAAPSGTGTAAHYGQCGGIGWTGPTACVSPYVCTKNGDYYSQCI